MSQTLRLPVTGRPLGLTCEMNRKGDDRLQIDFELLAPQDTPLTGIALAVRPRRVVRSIAVVSANGDVQEAALPIKRGAVGMEATRVRLRTTDDDVTTIEISPARRIEAENDELRIWLAGKVVPGRTPLKTGLTIRSSGKLKFYPAEFDAVTRTDTANWFPYPVGAGGTPVDLSFLNKDSRGEYVPAGVHGFLRVKGDDFVFDDGTPARFWGVNLTAYAAVTDPRRAEQLAERLARLGVNLVRLHHLDSDWAPNIIDRKAADGTTQHLSEPRMRQLDKMIYELKRRGIYVVLDPWVGRSLLPGDGIPSSDKFAKGNFGLHPYMFFDPALQRIHRKFLREVWTRINTCTGVAYKDDPAIALTECANEALFSTENLLEPYRTELLGLYHRWCEAHGEQPSAGDAVLHRTWEVQHERFYRDLMASFYTDTRRFMKEELGLKIPINDSNWYHWPWEIASQAGGDFMDAHHYYGGDRIGPGYGLGGLWVAHPPGLQHSPFGPIAAMALVGKPLTVSECGNNPPKTYRSAYYVGLAAVACLQGWDAITPFAYSNSQAATQVLGAYEMESDPATVASIAAGALIYRRGDVRPATQSAVMTLTGGEQFAMHWQDDYLGAFESTAGFNVALETHKVGVAIADDSHRVDPSLVRGAAVTLDPAGALAAKPRGTSVRSDTGELWRDWQAGVGTVDTPRTQAAYGLVGAGGKAWSTRNCRFEIATRYATVALSSLTDEPIKASRRLLLTAVARAENSGTGYNLVATRIVQSGKGPVLAEPVVGTVSFDTDAPAMFVRPIAWDGSRGAAVPVEIVSGRAKVKLTDAARTLFYELTRSP